MLPAGIQAFRGILIMMFLRASTEKPEKKKKKKSKDVLETSSVAMKTLHQNITLTNIS